MIASSRMANVWSFDYANTYLNVNPWHEGAAKAIEYQSASDHMKLHHQQCADIRLLSSEKDILPPLMQWISDARSDGHDLLLSPSVRCPKAAEWARSCWPRSCSRPVRQGGEVHTSTTCW